MIKPQLLLISGLLALTSFVDNNVNFPPLPKIKSVTEWRQSVDTTYINERAKWLKSQRLYYPNGKLQQTLYVEYNGDTTDLRIYKLTKDSLVKEEIWYNSFSKKWMNDDKYYYNKGEKLPVYTADEDGYTTYYRYNPSGQIINKRLSDDMKQNFGEHEYIYDTNNLLIQHTEYDFFGGKKEKKNVYVYEYEMNENGQMIKRNAYFIPHTAKEPTNKTDNQGNQKTTYYPLHTKTKKITETIFYKDNGERVKKIEYDRRSQPQIISTYDYEYYQ
ncbi:MAG: hypothetical protein V4642_08145 [Bacteroidota bacterium]